MNRIQQRLIRRIRRKRGLRKRILGVPSRPRLTILRSSKHIYAQIIDDLSGRTLASASTNEKGSKVNPGGNCEAASEVGKRLADRAQTAGVKQIKVDRNGYRYHGRIRALADAAREGGLKF